ncbi:DUF1910 domain-containing protein, partial [Campylobacter jejuni]|nr:DUF1910 domain-containing protein [Campylobacter jejuni]
NRVGKKKLKKMKKTLRTSTRRCKKGKLFFSITDGKKCIAIDKYSRGDDINLVKKDLEAYILLKQKIV